MYNSDLVGCLVSWGIFQTEKGGLALMECYVVSRYSAGRKSLKKWYKSHHSALRVSLTVRSLEV